MHEAIRLVERDYWYKKDVTLDIPGYRLNLGVAQELFSSHEVDAGSKHLLRSLPPLPEVGYGLDFGCGYGVLGLAIAKAKSGWRADLVDRDALAVEFSQRNAVRNQVHDRTTCRVGLDASGEPTGGWDLILWNVPGKVGESVQRGLLRDCLERLASDGLLALVIVNPLAELIRTEIAGPTFDIVHDQRFAEHNVVHIRRQNQSFVSSLPSAFERGLFDRDPVAFSTPAGSWQINPVIGLPEYASLDYATELALGLLAAEAKNYQSCLGLQPGQGHIALGVRNLCGTEAFTFVDRDALALAATGRVLRRAGASIIEIASAELNPDGIEAELAVLMLEDPIRPPVLRARIRQLHATPALKTIVIAGSSTPVTRFADGIRKLAGWKERTRTKRKGHAAVLFEII